MEAASSNPITVLFVFFFDFIFYKLIYLSIDVHVIHIYFQTNLVAEYLLNDI